MRNKPRWGAASDRATVRELLGWFGAERRGNHPVRRVRAARGRGEDNVGRSLAKPQTVSHRRICARPNDELCNIPEGVRLP